MSSQQYQRAGLNPAQAPNTSIQTKQISTGGHDDVRRDSNPTPSSGAAPPARDDKQEPVVVRPYGAPPPVAPSLTQHLPMAFAEGPGKVQAALKASVPSRVIAPAPTLALPHKPPGHLEGTAPQAAAIPVATISGQQGHGGNLHRIIPTQVQIIRAAAPAIQMGSSAGPPAPPPPHQFPSHLPRGAAAAAVMSSAKGPTVLRPASSNPGGGQPTVQHIIHPPIQSRPIVTTSTAVMPTVVAPVTATRPQSPIISSVTTHSGDLMHGRPALTIHPPAATLSIQRPPSSRDLPARITLPSHPAMGAQKPLPHAMAQKPIFSSVTPVVAATVAPILATNAAPPTTAPGPLAQLPGGNIVTVTMASHAGHAPAVTTSTIPVAKVVPQPITHASTRIQPEFAAVPTLRSSPNPVAMESRGDNRPSVPVQFQYFLPTYQPASYPMTYTPITSSVSTIRPFPVTAQPPTAAQPGVGVASAVHLNSMQLMTVDRIAQINTQNLQPAGVATQAVQNPPGPTATPLNPHQAPSEPKTSVVLADGSTLVGTANAFGAGQHVGTATQAHPQGPGAGASALASSPRPSILRKKPAGDGSSVRKNLMTASQLGDSARMDVGMRSAAGSPRPGGPKPKPEVLGALGAPVDAPHRPGSELQHQGATPGSSQVPAQPVSSHVTPAALPPQPVAVGNVTVPSAAPPPGGNAACALSSALPDLNTKQEEEPVDISKAAGAAPPPGAPSDLPPGASPRKKPRKQQHVISTEDPEVMETHSTDEDKPPARAPGHRPDKRRSPPKEYIDEEGVRYVPMKIRPPITLLRHYRNPWRAAYHHFQRYSDVRVKEDKKGTLQDVANQKGALCRAQGWKVHLCAAQLQQLTNMEHDVYSRLNGLQEGLAPKKKGAAEDDLHRISELVQGNMQRCKLVMDQISEAREAMLKVLDHRERVLKLLNKNCSTKKLHKLKRKDRA